MYVACGALELAVLALAAAAWPLGQGSRPGDFGLAGPTLRMKSKLPTSYHKGICV